MVTLKQTGVIETIISCPVKTPGPSSYTRVSRVPVPTELQLSAFLDTLLNVVEDPLVDGVTNRLGP